jgi:hypothetical protein
MPEPESSRREASLLITRAGPSIHADVVRFRLMTMSSGRKSALKRHPLKVSSGRRS